MFTDVLLARRSAFRSEPSGRGLATLALLGDEDHVSASLCGWRQISAASCSCPPVESRFSYLVLGSVFRSIDPASVAVASDFHAH